MYVFGGTVGGARTAMQESLDDFIGGCVAEFERTRAEELSESEKASWRNSWPELLGALTRAGLGDLRLFLEYELPGTGQRVDALLLGAREDGGLAAIVVELKQWDSCEWADDRAPLRRAQPPGRERDPGGEVAPSERPGSLEATPPGATGGRRRRRRPV